MSRKRWASLHAADSLFPELFGAGYARQRVVWGQDANSVWMREPVVFKVAAGWTLTHVGLWDSQVDGNFTAGIELDHYATFARRGTYTVTDLSWTLEEAP